MAKTAVDIVSITTGRESLLIGPASAFGAKSRNFILRDRPRIQGILQVFMTRPGAVDLLRPHLRRWGINTAHSSVSEREYMRQMLLKAIWSGQLVLSVAPDVTRGFSTPHATMVQKTAAHAKVADKPHLPDNIEDRLAIVLEMVPDYMAGEAKAAFVDTVKSLGIAAIVGGLIAWIGAHFVPGLNIAVLAFDLFFLGADVLKACETIASTIDDIRRAKSRQELEPVAKIVATAIAVLLVAGVFRRLLKAKSLTRAVGKKTRHKIDEKVGSSKERTPAREAQTPKARAEEVPKKAAGTDKSPGGGDKPLKASMRDIVLNNVKNTKKGQRPPPETYIPKNEVDDHLKKFEGGASRIMLKKNVDKYGPGQKDGTSFVLPKDEADKLLASAGGDKRKLEDALGLPAGTLNDNELVRVDIADPKKLNVRMPSGNEAGAMTFGYPGGSFRTATARLSSM